MVARSSVPSATVLSTEDSTVESTAAATWRKEEKTVQKRSGALSQCRRTEKSASFRSFVCLAVKLCASAMWATDLLLLLQLLRELSVASLDRRRQLRGLRIQAALRLQRR